MPRPVTTGTGVPTASQLHDATFAAVTSGWALTVFDAGTYDASHGPVPGIRLAYLVSPSGQRFEVAHFPAGQDVDVAATQLVTEAQVDAFTGAVTGPGVPQFVGNCVVGNTEILEVATTGRAAAYASSGGLTQPGLSESVGAEYCWGGSGQTALFSGHGSLWTYVQGGATVPLAVVSGALNPGDVIGVAQTRSIIAS